MPARILIVEDHADLREILKLQIQTMGYRVIEAENDQKGLEKALAETPDLIIMDLGLPEMNGIEATVRLKENPKTVHIPVIAHTAWSPTDWREKALRAGMVEYLNKPVRLQVLRETIGRFLQRGP